MPRLPLLPTLLVGLAVAAMIALGVWQLDRRQWKEALLARFEANLDAPAIAFPDPPIGEEHLFRKAGAFCLRATAWQRRGGRSAEGISGYRVIAECATGGMEGPVLLVDMGVATTPDFTPDWNGGEIKGTIATAPSETSAFASMFSAPEPAKLMLISDTPAPGLARTAPPDPASVPNNHLAYAVQWFLFAGIAAAIYLLALRRRQKRERDSRAPGA